MERAIVEWFDEIAGFGYVKTESGDPLHVHFSAIEGAGTRTLIVGEWVTVCRKNGAHAAKVTPDIPRPIPWRAPRNWLLRRVTKWLHQRRSVRYMWKQENDLPVVTMIRYYLVFTPWVEIYLHQFMSDDAEFFHDHPWSFTSLLISGEYQERFETETPPRTRKRFSLSWTNRSKRHRVTLPEGTSGQTLSIVITFGKRRAWHFYKPGTGDSVTPSQFSANSSYELPTLETFSPRRGVFPIVNDGTKAPSNRHR